MIISTEQRHGHNTSYHYYDYYLGMSTANPQVQVTDPLEFPCLIEIVV
jgi:hypothetical protein